MGRPPWPPFLSPEQGLLGPALCLPLVRGEPPAESTGPLTRILLLALLAAACSVTPLSHRISIGEEPYVIFVGEGPAGGADLFAVTAAGGSTIQLTFTRALELLPALAPNGIVLAFMRDSGTEDAASLDLVFLNLLTGAERAAALPDSVGSVEALGWSEDGLALYLRTTEGRFTIDPPPAQPSVHALAADAEARADSALDLLLGRPPFARLVHCPAPGGEEGLCAESRDGERQMLVSGAREPFAWGADSVAWFLGDEIEIRPLGGRRARRLPWKNPPRHPRQATYFTPTP